MSKEQEFEMIMRVVRSEAPHKQAVQELVRCKNCKYLDIKDFVYGYCNHKMSGIVEPDDFCSHGERRDGKEGDIGGFVENETDLLHEGDEWINDNASVYGDGVIL